MAGAAARRPGAKPRGGGGAGKRSAWLAADGSKRWGEAFFLLYTPFSRRRKRSQGLRLLLLPKSASVELKREGVR
uniref:Uncharacterized protein n=1 Tax=Zea mays TaxID=4577 RepID=B6UBH2_MAIZE|nr:hypothetical protein [Zea mays]